MGVIAKLKKQIKEGNEKGAREAVLEDLFNDFNRNRYAIYRMNFFRGISFGFVLWRSINYNMKLY
jgi:hypothetical protein